MQHARFICMLVRLWSSLWQDMCLPIIYLLWNMPDLGNQVITKHYPSENAKQLYLSKNANRFKQASGKTTEHVTNPWTRRWSVRNVNTTQTNIAASSTRPNSRAFDCVDLKRMWRTLSFTHVPTYPMKCPNELHQTQTVEVETVVRT